MILVADHAQTDVDRGLPLAEILAAEWSVLQPSEDKPELAQLAVSPTGRAAHVYLLPGEGERADPVAVGERLAEIEGVDLVCRLLDAEGAPLYRPEPGMPAVAATSGRWSSGRGSRMRFRPGDDVADLRGGRWEIDGELGVLEAQVVDGKLRSEDYPDPLQRVWSALTAPHSGDFVALARRRLRGGRLGRREPRRRRQPRRPPRRRQPRAAALRRLRAGVGRRARAVDAPRRRPGGARPLRPRWR